MAKGRDGAALENIRNGCGAYGFKRGPYILSGPVPTVLNDLPTADDRTSVDGHTSPGPKRPVRYIASLRETGEWVLAESAKQRVWRYTVPLSTGADAPVGVFFLRVGRRDWVRSVARATRAIVAADRPQAVSVVARDGLPLLGIVEASLFDAVSLLLDFQPLQSAPG